MKSKEEKTMREFMAFLNGFEPEDELEETAEDYLEMAEEAGSKRKKLELIEKALELDPENIEAHVFKAELTGKSKRELLETVDRLLKREEERLKREGLFGKDSIGEFWLLYETRPYMRLLQLQMTTLLECGMMTQAARTGERMLELCENDNLGVRHGLMHIYALLERETEAKRLRKRYREENSALLLLPLSVLYYKRGDEEKARAVLKEVGQYNKDLKKFVASACKNDVDKYWDDMSPYGYRPFCIDELVYEHDAYQFLFSTTPEYFLWAKEVLRGDRQKASGAKTDDGGQNG